MSEANLEILASRAGLAVDWIDANGRPQHVKPDALRAVLKGLGHPADSDAEIEASLLDLERVQQDKHLPPLMTVDSGEGLDLARYFAADTPCRVSLETGETLELRLDGDAVLPGVIALGYHQVHIDDQTFTLAVAPAHCYSVAEAVDAQPARAWGLSAQLYALRRLGDGGFGDTQALEHMVRAAAERGADALAISPIHALSGGQQARAHLARVRAQGHALVDQEFEPGLRTVAVPLRNRRGEVVASMNVSVHAARVSIPDLLDRCLPMLLQAQEQLKPLL